MYGFSMAGVLNITCIQFLVNFLDTGRVIPLKDQKFCYTLILLLYSVALVYNRAPFASSD